MFSAEDISDLSGITNSLTQNFELGKRRVDEGIQRHLNRKIKEGTRMSRGLTVLKQLINEREDLNKIRQTLSQHEMVEAQVVGEVLEWSMRIRKKKRERDQSRR
ncbi:MAG: hypothetical protein AAGM67_08985 [Bacteroidota bacterium]